MTAMSTDLPPHIAHRAHRVFRHLRSRLAQERLLALQRVTGQAAEEVRRVAGQLQALADGTYAGSRSAQVAQELEAVAGGLVQLAEDLGRPFLLFVVGMGKFGKSTLINALLGQRVAAMDALPKTWKIDVFTHTLPENVAEVRTYQGHVERLSVHKAVELIAEEERRREESEEKVWQLFQERARELSSVAEKEILRQELETLYLYRSPIVEVKWPVRTGRIAGHFDVVDTPGLWQERPERKRPADTAAADSQPFSLVSSEDLRSYYLQADGVLWMLDATKLAAGKPHELMADLNAALSRVGGVARNAVAVLNRIDLVRRNGGEEAVARVIRQAHSLLAGLFRHVIPVSAREALEAQEAGDAERLRVSGLPDLLAVIDQEFQVGGAGVRWWSKSEGRHQYLRQVQTVSQRYRQELSEAEGSPVRRARNQGRAVPEPAALDSIDEIPRRLIALRERVAKPLTLAVLGEVKAGKSTLVNALVGADVAPVDILEATQWVMEIRHGPAPHALLRFTDGASQEGTPQQIHDLLFAERQNPDFISRCAEVIVSLPQQTLTRLHLIDTPGLATVTEQAAARTRHHLTRVDAVLWVLNANHLGQMDVVSEVADVARLGKPIFAVINRIDEVDGDPTRLVRYVRTRLAEYVQDVFAISARKARQAQQEGNTSLLDASGVPEIRTFLDERIDRRAFEVQAQALSQQLLALLQLEQTVHETYAHQLAFLIHETDSHFQRLEIERQRIQNEAELFVEDELDAYFHGVANEFTRRIPESRGLDALFKGRMTHMVEILENDLQSALGGELFSAWAEQLAPKVEAFLREKWQEATGQMEIQLRERFQAFYAGEARRLDAVEGIGASSEILEGLKEGLTTGGVIGAGLAAYAAAIGPGAAYITMGAALSALLPPALLVGAGAGIVMRFLQSGQQAERLRVGLRDAIVRHKHLVRSEWVEPTLLPALAKYNAAITDALTRAFTEKLCQGWSMEELKALAQEVAVYLTECQEARQRLHNKAETSAG